MKMMLLARPLRRAALVALAAVALASNASLAQQQPSSPSRLGRVEFQTSASSREAQEHFLRGVAALHSFWYEEALEEFRAAARLEPDFVMARWGEAMTHNHPLWGEQDTEAGRAAVASFRDLPRLTPRERAYLAAVRALYGEGDKAARDAAYAAAMERIHRDHPGDLEAASFYALALLGTVRPGERGFSRQMKAGALALEVYGRNPEHPGAAHYIIHAFDDPEHAVLALPAARRYAEIAPAAHHARHMPSHIFLQLGMWQEAAASNESAWQVSNDWVDSKRLAPGLRDYHSLHWLTYVYLQQGRYDEAEKLLARKLSDMQASGYDPRVSRAYTDMAGAFLVETGRWERAAALLEAAQRIGGAHAYNVAAAPPDKCHAAATNAQTTNAQTTNAQTASAPASATNATTGAQGSAASAQAPVERGAAVTRDVAVARMHPLHFRGMVAAYTKDAATAERVAAELRALRAPFGTSPLGKRIAVQELEISALVAASRGRHDAAVELMRQATKLEEELSPPSGPPDFLKPSHELFGEILLDAKRPAEAAEQFAQALRRQPNRARSLLGAARAAAAAKNDAAASAAYRALLKHWERADASLPELREARSFVEQARMKR
jgi:tetratricopeptide (TPR) repeat protein